VFSCSGTGDWKVARTRRLESLRYVITVNALTQRREGANKTRMEDGGLRMAKAESGKREGGNVSVNTGGASVPTSRSEPKADGSRGRSPHQPINANFPNSGQGGFNS
jgi:hypothetical protein